MPAPSTIKEYKAPKPTYSWKSWAKWLAIRVFFPPILLWDAAKFAVNWLLGEKVGELVLPAQSERFRQSFKANNLEQHRESFIAQVNSKNRCYAEKSIVITHDGAKLDTVEIKYNLSQPSANEQLYIINFVGNGMCYEAILEDMKKDAIALQCNVRGFNQRGVFDSTGKPRSADDLVTDGIAQVQRLLDMGVNPNKIYLKGHSLGAAIATLVAKHFHDNEKKIHIFNGRSFSTITNFLIGHIRRSGENGHQESLGRKILGWILAPFIKFGVTLVKWEINAASAFKALPDSHKEYMVVRSPKAVRAANPNVVDDLVIVHYASLHEALESERKKEKQKIDNVIRILTNSTSPVIIRKELHKAGKKAKQARDCYMKRKMVVCNWKENGHNASFDHLHNGYYINANRKANSFFEEFVTRTQELHTDNCVPEQPAERVTLRS